MIRRTSGPELWLFVHYPSLVAVLSTGVVALPSVFLQHSWGSVVTFLIATFLAVLFWTSLTWIDDYRKQKVLLSGYLQRFSSCSFTRHELAEYATNLTQVNYEAQTYPIELGNRKSFDFRLEHHIELYVVKRGHSRSVPQQFASYELSSPYPNYVFIRDEPKKIAPLGLFFIYHEVGHASFLASATGQYSRIGWAAFCLPLLWCLINVKPTVASALVVSAYLTALIVTYPVYHRALAKQRVNQEIAADNFALRLLSPLECGSFAKTIAKLGHLPFDSSMSPAQNEQRSRVLLEALNPADHASPTKVLRFIVDPAIVYVQFLLALLVPVLGFFARSPSFLTYCFNALLVIIACVFLLEMHEKKSNLRAEADRILSPKPALP